MKSKTLYKMLNPAMRCENREEGILGAECNKLATHVAVKNSLMTKSGLFFSGRCAQCACKASSSNGDAIRFEALTNQKNIY